MGVDYLLESDFLKRIKLKNKKAPENFRGFYWLHLLNL